MCKRLLTFVSVAALAIGSSMTVRASGFLDTIDITGNVPSPLAGQIVARFVSTQWDVRTIPVQYRVNDALDPLRNPIGPIPGVKGDPFLSIADASAVLQRSLDAWNEIPTSYIDMRIVGTYNNPSTQGIVGFDMVNEVSFRNPGTFGAIAASSSVTMVSDTELVPGMDIDGDGDSDVYAGMTVAADWDGDSDIEFPPGFYKAGTILDNDVQFNTRTATGLRFTIEDSQIDTNPRSVDLMAVAVHEFGHSQGLSHDLNNQTSAEDGTGSTMFPFIDTSDPVSELAARSLHADDRAWSSYRYPEGSADSGPASLADGDIAFDRMYGVITGTIWHGVLNQPVIGASISATDRQTGRLVATAFSGTAQASFNPANGGLFAIPANPGFHMINGEYRLPVPRGSYAVGIEALDGSPVPSASISLTAQTGTIFGQHTFNEEFYNAQGESDLEVLPGQATDVHVDPGLVVTDINVVTNRSINLNLFGNRTSGLLGTPGLYFAVRVPIDRLAAASPGPDVLIQGIAFDNVLVDASVAPLFSEAMLTTGVLNANGTATVNMASPLARVTDFLGQDTDFAPFYFDDPRQVSQDVRRGIDSGEIQNLFLVLRLPTTTPFPGVSAQPPAVGISTTAPLFGLSFVSGNGIDYVPNSGFDLRFSLMLAEPGPQSGS